MDHIELQENFNRLYQNQSKNLNFYSHQANEKLKNYPIYVKLVAALSQAEKQLEIMAKKLGITKKSKKKSNKNSKRSPNRKHQTAPDINRFTLISVLVIIYLSTSLVIKKHQKLQASQEINFDQIVESLEPKPKTTPRPAVNLELPVKPPTPPEAHVIVPNPPVQPVSETNSYSFDSNPGPVEPHPVAAFQTQNTGYHYEETGTTPPPVTQKPVDTDWKSPSNTANNIVNLLEPTVPQKLPPRQPINVNQTLGALQKLDNLVAEHHANTISFNGNQPSAITQPLIQNPNSLTFKPYIQSCTVDPPSGQPDKIVYMKIPGTGGNTIANLVIRNQIKTSQDSVIGFLKNPTDVSSEVAFRKDLLVPYHTKSGKTMSTANLGTQKYDILAYNFKFSDEVYSVLTDPYKTFYLSSIRNTVDRVITTFYNFQHSEPFLSMFGPQSSNPIEDIDQRILLFFDNPEKYYQEGMKYGFRLKNQLSHSFGFDGSDNSFASLSKTWNFIINADYFDQSLILLKEIFCWNWRDIIAYKLRTRPKSDNINDDVKSKLTPQQIQNIIQFNHLDQLLYEKYNQTFWHFAQHEMKSRYYYDISKLGNDVGQFRAKEQEFLSACQKEMNGGSKNSGMIKRCQLSRMDNEALNAHIKN